MWPNCGYLDNQKLSGSGMTKEHGVPMSIPAAPMGIPIPAAPMGIPIPPTTVNVIAPPAVRLEDQAAAFYDAQSRVVTTKLPVAVTCPHCQHHGLTKVTSRFGQGTWFWAMFVCCFACCVCRDAVHQCERCGRVIGKHTPPCT